jgi:putative membrane protein
MQIKRLLVLTSTLVLATACGRSVPSGGAAAIEPPKPARAEGEPIVLWEEGETPEVQPVAGVDDEEFVRFAASSSNLEIEASRRVTDQLAPAHTQTLAEDLSSDHIRINQQLEALAALKGWPIPDGLLPQHQQKLAELERAPAEQVADLYLSLQREAHNDAITQFEACARQCRDDDLRDFAATTLLMLREHKRQLDAHVPYRP